MSRSLTIDDIREARERLGDQVVLTPCTRSMAFGDLLACSLWLKFETRQRTGSFKDRGALNKLLQLSGEERSRGIVTASAGNHAQAVAHHATRYLSEEERLARYLHRRPFEVSLRT